MEGEQKTGGEDICAGKKTMEHTASWTSGDEGGKEGLLKQGITGVGNSRTEDSAIVANETLQLRRGEEGELGSANRRARFPWRY